MKKIILFISLSVLTATVILYPSCKKSSPCTAASTGGNLTIVAWPQHHTVPIPRLESPYNDSTHADTAFVKFNTQNAPSNGVYDLKIVGEANEQHVHIEGLTCGDYYIYMKGWDKSISQPVSGGMPYSTTQKSGEINVNVAVTE